MSDDLIEHIAFIGHIPPFEDLPKEAINLILAHLSISYCRARENLLELQSDVQSKLIIVRKGSIARVSNGKIVEKFGEGDGFLLAPGQAAQNLIVEEDALVYVGVVEMLQKELSDYPDIMAHWHKAPEQRIHDSVTAQQLDQLEASPLNSMTVEGFAHTPAATIDMNKSIQDAAIKMTELKYSSLVVVDDSGHQGIVTDKDIRSRCVAEGVDPRLAIKTIMTADMTTIDSDQIAFDGLLTMIEQGIHHLPVLKSGKLFGMLTLTDLMHKESQNAAHLTSAIRKADSVESLAQIGHLLPQLQLKMSKLGISASAIAKSISALSRAMTVRLVQLGQQKLGPAPVKFAWLCAGSLARGEQLALSDQDNALIYEDSATDSDKQWLHELAHFVCDGLNECGFIYCPGNIMASNPKWCQSQSRWQQYFEQWVNTPSPKALLNCTVFFDLETVCGDAELLAKVKQKVLQITQRSTLFIAHLSRNAVLNKPPLGFFRDFVLISSGENKSSMDIKHNAIALVVDLARIYALALGLPETSTLDRLRLSMGSSMLSAPAGKSLIAAYEFLTQLRIEQQAEQIQQGKKPSNYVSPKNISRLKRSHLKDAFKVIKDLQDARQVVY